MRQPNDFTYRGYRIHIRMSGEFGEGTYSVTVTDKDDMEILFDGWGKTRTGAVVLAKKWIDKEKKSNPDYYERFLK